MSDCVTMGCTRPGVVGVKMAGRCTTCYTRDRYQRSESVRARRCAVQREWYEHNVPRRGLYNDHQRYVASDLPSDYWRSMPQTSQASWKRVLMRDPCSYCGGPSDTVDHIVPRISDGEDDSGNLTGACASCNSSKWVRPLLRHFLVRLVESDIAPLLDERATVLA